MTDSPIARPDRLTRFIIEAAGVRGVHVHLDETWQQIRGRVDYPDAVASLLGQACAASALFTGHTKVDGRLSVQLRGERGLRTLFAECTGAGTLRGIAQLAEDGDIDTDLRAMGENAVLAITIENPSRGDREPIRYQGLVSLQADTLAEAFEDYFVRSEQLPTRLLLAASGPRASGLMLQKLPGDVGDDDGWARTVALFDTLGADELLATDPEVITRRLFHEDGVQMLGERPLRFGCSCSRERVASMLESLGPEEARAALADHGEARVRCEFCGETYRFSSSQIDALFGTRDPTMPSPGTLQ